MTEDFKYLECKKKAKVFPMEEYDQTQTTHFLFFCLNCLQSILVAEHASSAAEITRLDWCLRVNAHDLMLLFSGKKTLLQLRTIILLTSSLFIRYNFLAAFSRVDALIHRGLCIKQTMH